MLSQEQEAHEFKYGYETFAIINNTTYNRNYSADLN